MLLKNACKTHIKLCIAGLPIWPHMSRCQYVGVYQLQNRLHWKTGTRIWMWLVFHMTVLEYYTPKVILTHSCFQEGRHNVHAHVCQANNNHACPELARQWPPITLLNVKSGIHSSWQQMVSPWNIKIICRDGTWIVHPNLVYQHPKGDQVRALNTNEFVHTDFCAPASLFVTTFVQVLRDDWYWTIDTHSGHGSLTRRWEPPCSHEWNHWSGLMPLCAQSIQIGLDCSSK